MSSRSPFTALSAAAAVALAGWLGLPSAARAQKAALVQSVDDPARTPYQHTIIFN